jgi:hypothetical protein
MDIITIEGQALDALFDQLGHRDYSVYRLRVARDGDEVKLKVNESTWSPGYPLAEEDRRRLDERERHVDRTRLLGLLSDFMSPDDVEMVDHELFAEEDQTVEPFACTAKIWGGPGHQSGHRCTRTDPHPPDGEHYVSEVTYEWTGPEAFTD